MPSVYPVKYVVLGILYIQNTHNTNRNDMNYETSTAAIMLVPVGLVTIETVEQRCRWGSETRLFGIKEVDDRQISAVRTLQSWHFVGAKDEAPTLEIVFNTMVV